MLKYDAVVFDLDGTLTDSAEGILNCTRYALNKMSYPVPDEGTLRKFLGPPLVASFRNHCGMSEEDAKLATAFYRERYVPIGWKENSVYGGIRSILQALRAQGARLYVATAKPQDVSIEILKHFGLFQYFDAIAGALPGETYPDKGDIIARSLQDAQYNSAVMVGDRGSDLRGAQKFGIDCIAAGYGYGTKEELCGVNPTHYAETTAELAEILLGEVPASKGYFISMEGLDGCGKTTQINAVEKFLKEMGFDVRRSREPGGCPIAEKIRNLLLDINNTGMNDICEVLLYAASRAQHVHEVIKPAIEKGQIVLCDRFVDSSVAFQGSGRQLGVSLIQQINAPAVDGCFPDTTVYLRLDHETALRRRENATALDRIENEKASFHARVEAGFEQLANESPERFIVVDARKTPEELSAEIRHQLLERLIAAGVA